MFKKFYVVVIVVIGFLVASYAYSQCYSCRGIGVKVCSSCGGAGSSGKCFSCDGAGVEMKRCSSCNGSGNSYSGSSCYSCNGTGSKVERCYSCRGTGSSGKCYSCRGTGVKECNYCNGSGNN